jgi:alkanesulfonate monooxygenase SsuD/methylene tetrahydromethanopterin reductase-like flavin-dependent oxidoreductase (luciferase family)
VLLAPTPTEVNAIARQIAALPPSKRGTPRQDVLDALDADRPLATAVDDWLVGTPDDVIRQLRAYTHLGISHFMLWFVDFPSLDGLRLFSESVIPALRSAV